MRKMAQNNAEKLMEKAVEAKARAIVKDEVRKLEGIVNDVVRAYYSSYTPKYYRRTYGFKNSVVSGSVKREGKRIWAEVYFDDKALHQSLFPGNPQGYVPVLLNNGWHSKKLEKRIGPVYHLTYYGGFDLVGKIEKRYNAVKHPLANLLKTKVMD